MNFSIHTLGCKVNTYESAAIARAFEDYGYTVVEYGEKSDVLCVNTCAVTEESVRKSCQAIRRAKRLNPDAVIAVCGCVSQTDKTLPSKLPEADVITGSGGKTRLPALVGRFLETGERVVEIGDISRENTFEKMTAERRGTTRAALKIQDGCNNFCSYCIIPYARGRIRSKPVDDAVCEAHELVRGGCKEIVLAGIHLDSYGKDTGGFGLIDLLERLDDIDGLERVRLGSLEPVFITPENVERMTFLRTLCPHFHLSLQSGCEKTLKAMNRHYSPDGFAAAVALLREKFPCCAVTTDIIVGFPGETDTDFRESLDFAVKIGFSKAHIFPFSERKGTKAAEMDGKVSQNVKAERCAEMIKACAEGEKKFYDGLCGSVVNVLFETEKNGVYTGHTPNYAEVRVQSEKPLENLIIPVKIETAHDTYAEGKVNL